MGEHSGELYSHLGFGVESTYGTAVAAAGARWPLNDGEGFEPQHDAVDHNGTPGIAALGRKYLRKRAVGPISEKLFDYDQMGKLLLSMITRQSTDTNGDSVEANYFWESTGPVETITARQYLGDSQFIYPGSVAGSWSLTQGDGEHLMWGADFLSRRMDTPIVSSGEAEFDFALAAPALFEHLTALTIKGVDFISASVHAIESLTLTVNRALDESKRALGYDGRPRPRRTGKMNVALTLQGIAWDDIMYDISQAEGSRGILEEFMRGLSTPGVIQADWNNGGATSAARALRLYGPAAYCEGDALKAAAGDLPVNLTFTLASGDIAGDALAFSGTNHAAASNVPMALGYLSSEDVSAL